jgi:hypothetical protein
MVRKKASPVAAIVYGALIAGVLDLLFAFWFFGARGRTPLWILQSIGAGWLGQRAFDGGAAAAALGALSHFAIMLIAATIFYVACSRLRLVANHAVGVGMAFGAAMYVVMTFVVLPLSAFPFRPSYPWRSVLTLLAVHMLLVGVPIAVAARYFATRSRR